MMWLRAGRAKAGESEIAGYENSDLVGLIVRRTAALLKIPRIDDMVPGELLAPTLLAVAATKADCPHVLDFGGAAGLHYLAAKQAFPAQRFCWAVIETPAMAEAATLGNDELRFFNSIETAKGWLERVDVVHSISALQYLAEPEVAIDSLISLNAAVVLWGKLMLGDRRETFTQTSRLKDNGPGALPDGVPDRKVTYQATRLARSAFLAVHARAGYRLAWKARDTDSYLFLSS
jgi:putative methyltransferase (TIGR04325 family)